MRIRLFLFLTINAHLFAQSDEFRVYTDAPRLFLNTQRLRLLQRERDRKTARWQQFDALVSSGAPMQEPGFALALHYRISGQAASGKQAVDWALSVAATDLRQLALVFDWCGPLLTPTQTDRLAAKIQRAMMNPSAEVKQQSARTLAAIALADRFSDHGEALLKPIIEQWWAGNIVKRIELGENAIPREQVYALLEMLHALRDNLKLDLREDAPAYFKALPTDHLVSHYPATFQGPDNDFHVPVYARDGEPDVPEMTLSRAAELAMVAFDSNAAETQFVQGWLMQDRFIMRGNLGAPYEFLWANPYQPGLSYYQVPMVYHDSATGHVFARTSWDEDATWLGYFNGRLQLFRDGQIQSLKPGTATAPVHVGDAELVSATSTEAFRFQADSQAVFILNLKPHATYDVEIDDEELSEEETDVGGTMVLQLPEGVSAGVRMKRRE